MMKIPWYDTTIARLLLWQCVLYYACWYNLHKWNKTARLEVDAPTWPGSAVTHKLCPEVVPGPLALAKKQPVTNSARCVKSVARYFKVLPQSVSQRQSRGKGNESQGAQKGKFVKALTSPTPFHQILGRSLGFTRNSSQPPKADSLLPQPWRSQWWLVGIGLYDLCLYTLW